MIFKTMPESRAPSAAPPARSGVSGAPGAPLPGVIAVVGCDGAGKTRLTHDLAQKLGETYPVERRYLGLISGETGDQIKALPLIGKPLERYLAAKAQRAQNTRKKLPGTATGLVMFVLSIWRTRKMRKMMRLSAQGKLVVTDRYPQAQIPGFHYDGPALPASQSTSKLINRLSAREQKMYDWMASQVPMLVIRLGVDLKTALERKPDHDSTELDDKIKAMQKLDFNGARIVDLDTRKPYEQILDAALKAVDESLQAQAL